MKHDRMVEIVEDMRRFLDEYDEYMNDPETGYDALTMLKLWTAELEEMV